MSVVFQNTEAPAAQTRLPKFAIAFNCELGGLVLMPPAADVLHKMLHADLVRAFADAGVSIVGEPDHENDFKPRPTVWAIAHANLLCGAALVNDCERGLAALAAELKRTGLFAHAETGYHSLDDMRWLRRWPKTDTSPFVPKLLNSQAHIVNAKLIETLLQLLPHGPKDPAL